MYEDWRLLGYIDVDAGIVWIGDPCYVMFKNDVNRPEELGRNWDEFCEKTWDQSNPGNFRDFDGLGVCVPTLHGDGRYAVYGLYNQGRIHQVKIVFELMDHEVECISCGKNAIEVNISPGRDICDDCEEDAYQARWDDDDKESEDDDEESE